jgi:Asp-tRNA(Asn)/Glu-tRNA(Gln) amidotransferase A subunit family amidase
MATSLIGHRPTKKDVREGKHEERTFPTNILIASQTWMPSICMPAGFSDDGLPVGVEFVGLPYHERYLVRLGSGFEVATKFRLRQGVRPEGSAFGLIQNELAKAA